MFAVAAAGTNIVDVAIDSKEPHDEIGTNWQVKHVGIDLPAGAVCMAFKQTKLGMGANI